MIILKKREMIIIIIVAALAAVSILLINQESSSSTERYIVITVNKELYKKIPFDDATMEKLVVQTDLGSNTIVIENGSVNVVDANCPDLVCVNTKPATQVGDMIVCLPHRLIIEITDR